TYLANDRVHAERRVMLKVLFFDKADAGFNRRFYEEKVALSHVNHPSIGGVLDAGELAEGRPFVVMEFVEGQSLRELLRENGKLNAIETARIVRQVAQALTEAHNNRILHRDLKPENIYLKPLETGGEQVKVLNFGIGSETDVRENNNTLTNLEDFVYQSPEQLEAKAPSPESDIYALAVIAYEMLTGQKPFGGLTAKSLRESQRRGIKVLPTDIRLDLQKEVNDVLSRAMSYNPSQRFHLAREFGENFNTALTENNAPETSQNGLSTLAPDEKTFAENVSSLTPFQAVSDLKYQAVQSRGEVADSTISTQTQTENRPVAPPISHKSVDETRPRTAKTIVVNPPLIVAGIIAALSLIGILGYATYGVLNFMNADDTVIVEETPQNQVNPVVQTTNNVSNIAAAPNEVQNTVENAPASPQIVVPPPNSVQFRSSREEVSGKLAEKFVGFSVKYPAKWQKNGEQGTGNAANFLDVANRVSTQEPLEQLIVSWYGSKGTFEADNADFPKYAPLLIRAYGFNEKTKSGIPKLRKVSEGATNLNGRDAYEVKLEGETVDKNDKNVKIWVRTVFLPTERSGANSGLTITMLATSLAPALSNVNDVGVKGELSLILETLQLEN
ncbi:MAG: serine/threonine protein kinase, partial [Pyrinomonadaceae bacterium]|nr:serine/threonine protein kinase [Pyrinomonadaceae bacterium]